MKEIYKKIIKKLFAPEVVQQFNALGVSPVRYVDLFRGQYQAWEKFDVVPLPAVLVDWSADLTDPTQNESKLTVSLHLVYEQVEDTSSLSASQTNALKFFDFVDLVHSVVSSIQIDGSGKLKLRRQEPAELDNPGIVHVLTYETTYLAMETDVKQLYDYTEVDEIELNEKGKLLQKRNWDDIDFGFETITNNL